MWGQFDRTDPSNDVSMAQLLSINLRYGSLECIQKLSDAQPLDTSETIKHILLVAIDCLSGFLIQ